MSKYLITYKRKVAETVEGMGFKKEKIKKRFRLAPIVIAELDSKEAKAVRGHKHVLAVEVDGIVNIPDDETLSSESAIAEDRAPWGITRVRAAEVHARGVKGAGVKVAIIDTGIDFNHPDLATIYKGGVNFVTPTAPPMDDNNHGTHCAGIASAILDGQGIFGVAPSIELYAVKVLNAQGSGSWSNIIAGYDWAIQNGMHVTSNSYGGSSGLVAVETALNAAVDAGILMIFAAGNSSSGVIYPAKYAKAIAVSATDQNDVIAGFSSRGPEIACAAPGVNIESTIRNGAYGVLSGTSMACPHVAGACALALSSGLTSSDVRARIRTTLKDLGSPGRDILYGWGFMDAYDFLFKVPVEPRFYSPVELNASSSYDVDGKVVDWAWQFSDGRTFLHLWSLNKIVFSTGTHSITLTVTDDRGGTGTMTRTVLIEEAPPQPPPPIPDNILPTAAFTINGM